MTYETERAQYAADVARLGPEAWRYWQMVFADIGWWIHCQRDPLWEEGMSYRRNPDTYLEEDE